MIIESLNEIINKIVGWRRKRQPIHDSVVWTKANVCDGPCTVQLTSRIEQPHY